jgi:HEAT repeat protein/cyclophilin family peptidyl-prolyl cis-trans isomerase
MLLMSRLQIVVAVASTLAFAQSGARRPLSPADIDDITRLVMLEDTRQFDREALARILQSEQPEVRRRGALSVGRIADPSGVALLESARADKDIEVVATVVFATGQLKDPTTVPWLSSILSSAGTPPAVAREAAIALGKFQVPEARAALAEYLASAPADSRSTVVGEALLSIGRFNAREDLAPILRWAASPDVDVRWRATWALFRPRNPAAGPHLLKLASDRSPDVRFWAIRGLTPPTAPQTAGGSPPPPSEGAPGTDPAGFDRATFAARLREAVKDPDRRVRTEALRALAQYDDDQSFAIVLAALDSPDTWLSVSAAENMGRFSDRADAVVPRLVAASGGTKPLALRITALTPLTTLAPEAAVNLASALAHVDSVVARMAARQALGRLGEAGRIQLEALTSERVLPPAPATGASRGRAGGGRGAPAAARPEAEYRRIVERWIVSGYNGAPKPTAILETSRGTIELELYPGDAPLGLDYFIRVVESGEIVGTEFGRVVPNFVAQQRAIRNDVTLRDEVNRHGLTRGNLSWASAGLDTGRPGYTLALTPQPHNEGNFTALGRVVAGMDVVERIELGDKITAARMKSSNP